MKAVLTVSPASRVDFRVQKLRANVCPVEMGSSLARQVLQNAKTVGKATSLRTKLPAVPAKLVHLGISRLLKGQPNARLVQQDVLQIRQHRAYVKIVLPAAFLLRKPAATTAKSAMLDKFQRRKDQLNVKPASLVPTQEDWATQYVQTANRENINPCVVARDKQTANSVPLAAPAIR